ncbi:hypothetical protein M8C21_000486 [Ambrosia artemisiifolia]|uniref:Disease resistance R13L4/SHOC-2-like LRR domain-containing protein n=1 Tax=Ambrosia artemisiifolia TaxID=4212 RepID=A0AAD5C796_AMBAR|nr:hypothetical protein M8C21_000486 [Ambrosia artemisiifolia]
MMFKPSSTLFFIIMLILSMALFLQITGIQAQVGHLPPNEADALQEIAKQLGKEDWDFSLNPCDGNASWRTPLSKNQSSQIFNNVVNCTCSPDDACHVVNISLKGQDLAGVLPPSLAKLPSIKMIDLSYNYLSGPIPHEWQSTELEFICLENNMLSGNVPAELGKLNKLNILVLTANNLTGELPMELNNLTNLTELRLDSNYFSGRIPNLGSLTQLQKLEIRGSGLEGPIPESISLLTNLSRLAISDLNGEGSQVFPNLSSMTKMNKLMLRGCRLTGSIPGYISQMSKLQYLDLSFNDLGGDIPDLSGLNNLEKMYLTGNSLNGNVPSWLTNQINNYRQVDLSYNHLNETTVPKECIEPLNLFRSYTSSEDSDLGKCLNRFPCLKDYYSVHINCGGQRVTIGDKVFEADIDLSGAARFLPSNDHWGISNTGRLVAHHCLSLTMVVA